MELEALIIEWVESLRRADHAATTVTRYKGAVRHFLAWHTVQERRPAQLNDLTPIALVGYRNSLQRNQSPATVNVHVAALRAWCGWLAESGHLSENPASRFRFVSQVEPDAPEPLSHTTINALLRAARRSRHGPRDYAIWQMLLQTGMRLGECRALCWQDVTFGERMGQVLIRSGKGNKARTLPLNHSVRAALVDYVAPFLSCDATAKAVALAWPLNKEGKQPTPLWLSQKGTPLSGPALWRVIKAAVQECASRGLAPADVRPHDLRHTFAHCYLEQHPGDLVGLARILGLFVYSLKTSDFR